MRCKIIGIFHLRHSINAPPERRYEISMNLVPLGSAWKPNMASQGTKLGIAKYLSSCRWIPQ
eukprot:2667181-Rhodomonas_salina.2